MKETLKKTVDRLPDIMAKNARTMMRRMVVAMNEEMARNIEEANASYSALLLKVSEADLVDAFEVALKDAMASLKGTPAKPAKFADSTLPLSLELADDANSSAQDDFLACTVLFDTLRANAKKLGVGGISPFSKDIFLTALKDAFTKSRIDSAEIGKLMPYARRALNRELLAVYDKLNALTQARPAPA